MIFANINYNNKLDFEITVADMRDILSATLTRHAVYAI